MIAWLSAFLFTQAVEIPIYALALGEQTWRSRLALAALPTILTHPIVWFVMPVLVKDWTLMVVVAETFAVLGEAAILWRWLGPRALAYALVANMASLGIGLSSRALFGWP